MADLLNDRYELGEVVGSGGMGAVYRARDTRLGRTVAVKVLRGGPLADEAARSRMRREASLAASINHPGVAQVFDFDDEKSCDAALTFIVMEFVDGQSLAQLLRDQGPMPADQVMSVVMQVAEGLQAAHEVGIVHRDLKPANIMLTPAGRTVLVDFGIARSLASEPLTNTGALVGTVDYMSPEQASGRLATPRSDLYALGVVAYHCLTGTSPFRRDSPVATAMAHLNDELPGLSPGLPAEVSGLVELLTSKNPSARPTSAAAVARQAAAFGAAKSIDLPSSFGPAAPDDARPQAGSSPTGLMVREAAVSPIAASRGRPRAVYAGVGLITCVLAFAGVQRMWSADPPVVPSVVGMSAADASTRIRDAGMSVRREAVDVAGKPAGYVVGQSPDGGAQVAEGRTIEISVATGKVRVSAADLVGQSYAKASAVLERMGFEVTRKNVSQSAGVGEVVALDRSGRLPDGSTITLSVAVAPVVATRQPVSSSSSPSGPSSTGKATKDRATKGKGKGKARSR
jgi:predicted Ser/Thr protein kinase